ncbi:hypothetical protein M0Q28_07075 [Patescibacteria group bacterium]|jgi:hypothetical protein|nr:hypothetical protein [Patescibacteria group bacterium]
MSKITYWRNVANEGRGSQMTMCLHEACDEVAKLEAEHAELIEALRGLFLGGYCEGGSYASQDFVSKKAMANARALLERINK